MKSFKKVFTRLFWSENQNDILVEPNKEAAFNVMLGNLLIGTLVFDEIKWHFSYSDDFKLQDRISPLANFPAIDKEYSTNELWPFFASRIPSNAQLQIDNPQDDIVKLLRDYGRKTVSNPFELLPA